MGQKQWRLMVIVLAALGGLVSDGQATPKTQRQWAQPAAQTSATIAYTTDQSPSGGSSGPLVRITLNNGTPATFLLDTGTSDCCVTDRMAAKLGLMPSGSGQAAAPLLMNGGQARSVPLTIQIGRFHFDRYPTLVIKASRVSQVLGRPLDGILGVNLLRRFALILEPRTHLLVLTTPGRLTEAQVQAWGFRRAGALPLTRAETGLYQGAIGLGNGARTALETLSIDTGAGSSVLSYRAAHSLRLIPTRQGLTVPFGSGVFTGDLASVPSVTLGNVRDTASAAVSALIQQDAAFLYSSSPESRTGPPHVLGMNILSGYSVLIDFPGATLYLQPVGP